MRCLSPGHTFSKWRAQDSNPRGLVLAQVPFTLCSLYSATFEEGIPLVQLAKCPFHFQPTPRYFVLHCSYFCGCFFFLLLPSMSIEQFLFYTSTHSSHYTKIESVYSSYCVKPGVVPKRRAMKECPKIPKDEGQCDNYFEGR